MKQEPPYKNYKTGLLQGVRDTKCILKRGWKNCKEEYAAQVLVTEKHLIYLTAGSVTQAWEMRSLCSFIFIPASAGRMCHSSQLESKNCLGKSPCVSENNLGKTIEGAILTKVCWIVYEIAV